MTFTHPWFGFHCFEFDSTGDASETEIDTVLLLTAECYLVAEYDSDLDKVVRFEKVNIFFSNFRYSEFL